MVTPPVLLEVPSPLRYRKIPDRKLYAPLFSPWLGLQPFADSYERIRQYTFLPPERAWVLHSLAQQALLIPGNFYEGGVYRGGSAMLLRDLLVSANSNKVLRLFDTFAGMPRTDPRLDVIKTGDFKDTQLAAVRRRLGDHAFVDIRAGLIPETFAGLEEDSVALAHIDVDIYSSITDCCSFIYPRLTPCGFMIFDDYGFQNCPGARTAVDRFFSDKPEVPLVLPTGQAVVFRTLPR